MLQMKDHSRASIRWNKKGDKVRSSQARGRERERERATKAKEAESAEEAA